MQLQYGNFVHGLGECTVSISRVSQMSEFGRPYLTTTTWGIEGEILGDNPAHTAARVVALERAYSFHGLDLTFWSAPNIILHRLRSAPSLAGVQIINPPSFPPTIGAEGVNGRKYTITAKADYPGFGTLVDPADPPNGEIVVRRYQETITSAGGGPRRSIVETVSGLPILFKTHSHTARRITQSGSAVGLNNYPKFPNLILGWEDYFLGDPVLTKDSPREGPNKLSEYPISWTYTYASPDAIQTPPTNYYRV